MKNLIYVKKHFLAVFAIMLSLGYGSFSFAKAKFAINWHTIKTQASLPKDDVVGPITMNPTQSGACTTPSNTIRCSIQFNNENDEELEDLTVEQAKALSGVTENGRTYRP